MARVAAAPAGSCDPVLSSWPAPFVAFTEACLRTLAELQSSRRGTGVVPLLDTDELYEAWLAIAVRNVLNARFGPWIVPASDALASWQYDDATIELWIKPGIARGGTNIGGTRLHALVAESLSPDLLLTASRGEVAAFTVIDAKSWASMMPEQALDQSAKYLYGIRLSDDPTLVPAIAGVALVTCAAAPSIGAPARSQVRVVSTTPTSGLYELGDHIGEITDQLLVSLVEREHTASEF